LTHLQWICKLTKYLSYICRTSFQIILGVIQLWGSGGVTRITTNRIVHPNYNPATLANDVALLRFSPPVLISGEYPSPVSLMLFCVCTAVICDLCSTLWLLPILGVDSHATDSVTHNDKVIITKDGQKTGPTINHLGWLLFIISK